MKKILTVFVITLAMLLTTQVTAKAECKGKEEAACKKDSDCTYVQSYKRQDGKKVDGYCRSKGNHGDKKNVTKKDDKKTPVKKDVTKKDDKKGPVKKDNKKTPVKKDNKKDK